MGCVRVCVCGTFSLNIRTKFWMKIHPISGVAKKQYYYLPQLRDANSFLNKKINLFQITQAGKLWILVVPGSTDFKALA